MDLSTNKYTLSIVIPSRSEMFLKNTVEDILKNKRGKTEIIIGLDGSWASPAIADHPDVSIIHYSESLGQREMTNQCVRLSKAKYIAKTDAHTSFSEGFDVEMLKTFEELGDEIVALPLMKNLHAFDWLCEKCGERRYQGPSGVCEKCGGETKMDIKWFAKPSPNSTSYCFDSEPHFQYFGAYKKKQEGDLVETMSLQGSFFMMTRENYWKLNIGDENFGSWGSQGIQIACSFWLSGRRCIVNKRCWYAHLFRTQGGDFSFPYHNPESKIQNAKKYARKLMVESNFPEQIRPVSWLVEKFAPVRGWSEEDLANIKKGDNLSSGIIYYTDNQLNMKLARKCRKQILKSGLPIVSTSLKPLDFGKNFVIKGERGQLTMFRQILKALEESDSDIIFFCEHDVLYHPSNFNFRPEKKDVFYYNDNLWRVRLADGFAVKFDHKSLSQICAYRETLIKEFKHRVEDVEKNGFHNGGYEPGTRSIKRGGFSDSKSEHFHSEEPNIDIRHDKNLSASKWKPEDFKSYRSCRNWEEGNIENLWGNNVLNK